MRRQSRGFTLLEMLIAMSLLGILIVVLYGGLHIAIQGWHKGSAQTERVTDMRLVESFLRDQLRQSVSVFRNDPDKGRVVYFEGETQRLGWVAPLMTYLGQGGLYFIELQPVPHDGGTALQLHWLVYRPTNELNEAPPADDTNSQTLLVDQVTAFKVSYFGTSQPGQDPAWTDNWDNLQQRPELVRIELAVANQAWPTLTVALLD